MRDQPRSRPSAKQVSAEVPASAWEFSLLVGPHGSEEFYVMMIHGGGLVPYEITHWRDIGPPASTIGMYATCRLTLRPGGSPSRGAV